MNDEIRIVIEKLSGTDQTIVERDIIQTYELQKPTSIAELGLSHQTQMTLLTKIQNVILAKQSDLISPTLTVCEKCGHKVSKNGFMTSIFHAVFSDHKLRLQKHRCTNPDCNWQSTPTTLTEFGTDTHPDVLKLQCEQGVSFSYRVAQKNLEKLNAQRRSVNNHVQIRTTTNRIGEIIATEQRKPSSSKAASASKLVIHLEHGFIPTRHHDRTEVQLGMIYRLESHPFDSPITHAITPTYVVSAIADDKKTFKNYLFNACLQEGLSPTTQVYGLVDQTGYWSQVLEGLQPYCRTVERLLDWEHVSRRFDTSQTDLSPLSAQFLEQAKLDVWQGVVDEALLKIEFMLANLPNQKQKRLLRQLQTYLLVNRNEFVDYRQREKNNMPFSGEAIDIHIDTLLKPRGHRQSQSRLTQQGVHSLLQIRAAMASRTWEERWQDSKRGPQRPVNNVMEIGFIA